MQTPGTGTVNITVISARQS